ncbi:MAG TPA: SMC-Scp complex subunit ScpB [Cytophagaceae bacterium]|jgi:segregation and condensation protein B|nr:SMC-Scp complex subunit ScpB [Cytophagaceae bacterium]
MDFLQNHVESIVFCATEPVKAEEIRLVMSEMFEAEVQIEDIEAALESLLVKYEPEEFSFQVYKIAGGYQFLTKPAYQTSLGIFLKQKSKKRLSTSALEVMAIIAYKQPITKGQVEDIRGVNCDYAVQKLLEKELVEIKGKSDGVGRPLLYGTSKKFMEYFGLNSLSELPNPKDFAALENTIGTELDPNFNDFAQFGLMEGEGQAHVETEEEREAAIKAGVQLDLEDVIRNEQQARQAEIQSGEENNIDQERNEQQEERE